MDQFSAINDTLGHAYGDMVLRAIAARLLKGLPGCTVARIGNDVFGVLGPGTQVHADALTQLLVENFEIESQPVRLTACLGLVALAGSTRRGNEFLSNAQVALKQAKLHQRGSAVFYSQSMGQDVRERTHMLTGLRDAIGAHHLFLVYQPKVKLSDGSPSGIEALMRWRKDNGQYVSPDRFIPLAEQAGMMATLGTYVLRSACQQLARLRVAGYVQLSMAVNVSQAQLREPDFIVVLRKSIEDSGLPPGQLELEITESMAADDLALLRHLLGEIAALGVKVAIDDFGTGFSSLSVLRHLQAQRLKIDRSFISEMAQDDSIARMVIGLGHTLGMSVTAEGVETPEQAQALRDMGCEEAQGFHFGRPMEEPALLAWLAAPGPRV
nr:bifunctional diguanylate cyclase/phosphodiesterase [uncultured Roseateles sp.]